MKKKTVSNFSFQPLEAEKMKKIHGGKMAAVGTSQLNTATVGSGGNGGDDGKDDLESGESQD